MEIDTLKYKVSVILTLYNSKRFFDPAINSILRQTHKEYELIIVDDGSIDGTEEKLFPLLKQFNNFKYIRHSNRGHPLSLNTGIVNSTGEFVTFLDSDDGYETNHLEQRVNYFKEKPEIDLIHSPAAIVGDEKDLYVPDAINTSKLIHLNDCIIGGTLFGKRKVFEELAGFKNIYSHDFDFYNRAKERFNIVKFDSPTYIYNRTNPNSILTKLKKTNERG